MNILMQILVFGGVTLVLYALYGVFSAPASAEKARPKKKAAGAKEPLVSFQEQRIQRLEGEVQFLEKELEKVRAEYSAEKKLFEKAISQEAQLKEELARRQEWVAKSEQMLDKAKEESLDLKNKFIAKEKELQIEFSKGVNLSRQIDHFKDQLESLDKQIKERSDTIEAQKHEILRLNKEIKAQQEIVSGYKKKEKESEWVPKAEFNRLNEEYTALEKELDTKEERLKLLTEEIIHLKKQMESRERLRLP